MSGMSAPISDFNESTLVLSADTYLQEPIRTIAAFPAERSMGNKNEYYSEGPYWWPDPENPDGPYIRKDGQRNPDRFVAHRAAISLFQDRVATLTAAYLITSEKKYSRRAIEHLKAWFVNADTRMLPHLEYAQAIKGIVTGRGIGIIDAVSLIDVCNAVRLLDQEGQLTTTTKDEIVSWFNSLSTWMVESPNGKEEAMHGNNHSVWWGAQLAAYSLLTGNQDHLTIAKQTFKKQLEIQMESDGSFPEELGRTRPWHYTNYILRAWAIYTLLLSDDEEDYWKFESSKGSLLKAFEYARYYRKTPSKWQHYTVLEKKISQQAQDHMLYTSIGYQDHDYLNEWRSYLPKGGSQNVKSFLFTKLYE